jgi:hypothetical protein
LKEHRVPICFPVGQEVGSLRFLVSLVQTNEGKRKADKRRGRRGHQQGQWPKLTAELGQGEVSSVT